MRTLRNPAFFLALSAVPLSLSACAGGTDEDAASEGSGLSTPSQIVSGIGGKCLDDNAGATSNGNKIQLWDCNRTSAQRWTVSGGLIQGPGGKCLDVKSNQQVAGATVQLYACNGTSAQQWTTSGKAIQSAGGLCLDVKDGVDARGTQIQLATCKGNDAQSWTIETGAAVDDGGAAPTGTSIRKYAKCDGTTDDAKAVATAFTAAKNNAFTLLVDCPVRMHIGDDIARSIFVEDHTKVVFSGAGRFIVDNMFVPAFAFANTTDVTMTGWNVEWDGSLPVDPDTLGGYYDDGTFVSRPGSNGAGVFNDNVITPWLTSHRGIVFDQSKGRLTSEWHGSVNNGALFLMYGDTSSIKIDGLNVHPVANAGGHQFVPFVFEFGSNFKSNQTVTAATPKTSKYFAVPHDLSFSNVTFDGTYMGFQGNLHDATFDHIHSLRYGDLQDANGGTVGGKSKYFPPPHLFYLNYDDSGDAGLFNHDITLTNVTDDGIRVGVARDKGGNDSISGYANSLKLGCHHCSVDNYTSHRPDGFMDALPADDFSLSNVTATYDSQFIHGLFPGWRFPAGPYTNTTYSNISLRDTAVTSAGGPLGNDTGATNSNIVFENVDIGLGTTATGNLPFPTIVGEGTNSIIRWTSTTAKGVMAASRSVTYTMQASPSTLKAGAATSVSWTARGATSCTSSWDSSISTRSSASVTIPTAGAHDLTLTCKNGADTVTAKVTVSAN